jgi:hypothetical protein
LFGLKEDIGGEQAFDLIARATDGMALGEVLFEGHKGVEA